MQSEYRLVQYYMYYAGKQLGLRKYFNGMKWLEWIELSRIDYFDLEPIDLV